MHKLYTVWNIDGQQWLQRETFRYNEYGYTCRVFVLQNLNYQLLIIY